MVEEAAALSGVLWCSHPNITNIGVWAMKLEELLNAQIQRSEVETWVWSNSALEPKALGRGPGAEAEEVATDLVVDV